MRRSHSWILLFLFLMPSAVSAQHSFIYTNPISSGIEGGIRDAQIFEENGTYYLIGTAPPFWGGPNPGIRIFSSKDILNWKFEKLLISRSEMDSSVWHFDRFWAPEVHKIGEKYYLLFNARNEMPKYKHRHGCGVAVADHLMGPYEIVTKDEPLTYGNDLSFFEDTDGKVYAYWNESKKITGSEIDLKTMDLKEKNYFFTTEEGAWDQVGIEGAYMILNDGIYYLFYSSWSRGYEIGYATSKSPLGPFVKYSGNPIYGAQYQPTCEKNGLEFTGDPNSVFRAVGHNQIWTGPDGRFWISCHGILNEEGPTPSLVIDPIWFEEGHIKTNGPTSTKQVVHDQY